MKKVLLGIVILSILVVGGCLAVLVGGANEVDKALTEEEKNDAPVEVTEGKSFDHDYMTVDDGWKITEEQFGGPTIKGLRMTNNSDERQNPGLTFKLYRGTENLIEIDCTANEVEAGESSKMDCFSGASKLPKKYDTIKVADMF